MQYKYKSQVQRMDNLFSSLSNSLIRTGLPSCTGCAEHYHDCSPSFSTSERKDCELFVIVPLNYAVGKIPQELCL